MYTSKWFAATALLVSLSAQAVNTVQLTSFTHNPFVNPAVNTDVFNPAHFITKIDVTSAPPEAGTYAGGGQLEGYLNGASFQAYCAEIDVRVVFGAPPPAPPLYNDYVLVSGIDGFGAAKAAQLAKLITWAKSGNDNTAAKSAVVQAAVWEIVHESAATYSFAGGNVRTSSANGVTASALNALDWSVINNTTATYTVSKLDGRSQDLLIFAPVPEAGTTAMMLLGLAGVGAVARKRRPT